MLVPVSMMALQLSRESYTVFPLSTVIEVKPWQLINGQYPNFFTLLGMVTEVKPSQLPKAFPPISSTLFGMVIEVKPPQLWKAPSPMNVTVLGMVTEARADLFQKHSPLIIVVPSLITISVLLGIAPLYL
jgi:hypothetical protein